MLKTIKVKVEFIARLLPWFALQCTRFLFFWSLSVINGIIIFPYFSGFNVTHTKPLKGPTYYLMTNFLTISLHSSLPSLVFLDKCVSTVALVLVHKSADCTRDAWYMAEKKPFCGNCFTSPLSRLSDWATSQCRTLREVLSVTRELARKSFWVPIQWQLDIIYQDSTIRGCGPQKRWRAELLPPHCQPCCHLSPAMTDG